MRTQEWLCGIQGRNLKFKFNLKCEQDQRWKQEERHLRRKCQVRRWTTGSRLTGRAPGFQDVWTTYPEKADAGQENRAWEGRCRAGGLSLGR